MARKLVIVISGMPGCGSTTTGKLLGDKLDIEFFSTGTYFKKLAAGMGGSGEARNAVNLWKTEKGSSKSFHNEIDEMQIKLAKRGNVIIESKLGITMLKDADFKIWLRAPLKTRAERYAQREKLTLKEAEKLVKEKESLERRHFKHIYGFDFFAQEKSADMVVDTSDKSPEDIVNIIVSSLKRKKLI